MARRCVLAWWRRNDSRAIKRRQYFVSKYGYQFTFNFYFHCCYGCCYVTCIWYIALIFFSAFLNLQSIRDDEATTSKELIFFNTLTDVLITSLKMQNNYFL